MAMQGGNRRDGWRRLLWLVLLLGGIGEGEVLAAELRVLTYNIHHGEGLDGRLDLPRIAKVIRSTTPDLVALNEVDQGVHRTQNVDQPGSLAKLTGMAVIFEKNIDHDGGKYGNAVLSRLPIVGHENIALPSMHDGEQRGMLTVKVEWGDRRPLVFAATHFDYRPDDRERWASVEKVNSVFAAQFSDHPAVLAGDLNAVPASRILGGLEGAWTIPEAGPTFPSKSPQRQIDYVLFRPATGWRVDEVRVIDTPEARVASDHRPLLVILRWQE